MYWRLRDLPELDHLLPAEKDALLRERLGSHGTGLVFRSIGIGFVPGMLSLAAAESFTPSPLLSVIIGLGVASVVAAVAYQVLLRYVRWQLRRYLKTRHSKGDLPICLHCGYDLRGTHNSRCPECGNSI